MPWRERGHTAPGEGRGNGMGTVFRQTSRKNIPGINRAAHIPLRFFLPSPDRFPGIKRIAMSLLLQVQTSGIGFHSGKKQGYAGKFGPSGIPVRPCPLDREKRIVRCFSARDIWPEIKVAPAVPFAMFQWPE